MKNKLIVTEIDLLKVILNIWQNKFKIIIITILTFFLFFGYFVINKKHVSVTKINPIAIINEDNYNYYNTQIELLDRKLGFQDSILGKKYINQLRIINRNYLDNHNKKINNTYVINLFYDEINNKKNLIHAINKFQSINKKNEKNDLYSRFIKNLSPFIEFNNQSIEYKYSNFSKSDEIKIQKIFKYLESEANRQVKNKLINQFKNRIQHHKDLIDLINESIDFLLNVQKLKKENEIKLLKKHAEIARFLDIRYYVKDINIRTSTHFLLGYLALEKQIELLENSKSDNDNDNEKNIYILNKLKMNLEKHTYKLENNFLNPILDDYTFKVANIDYKNTIFKKASELKILLPVSIIIGLSLGILFVIINLRLKLIK